MRRAVCGGWIRALCEWSFGVTNVTRSFLGLLENEYIKYDPSTLDKKQKVINLIIGLVVLLAMYLPLEMLIEGSIILEFIKYAILAFGLMFVIPLIFTKINKR